MPALAELGSPTWMVWLAPAATVLAAIIANIVIWKKVRADLSAALLKEHYVKLVERHSKRLEQLYNPIMTLSRVNAEIFATHGPKSAAKGGDIHSEEAAQLWDHLVKTVILPNNEAIRSAIIHFGHLAGSEDERNACHDFVRHSISYESFRQFPNSQHKAFPFPTHFIPTMKVGYDIALNQLGEAQASLSGS